MRPDAAPWSATDTPATDLGVTRDGSPVAVYLAAPAGETVPVLATLRRPPASVLELGSGPGRETRPLVACGYDVTAVDDSEVALEHVTGARTVLGDVLTLALEERFDVVLAGSHVIDDADGSRRAAVLAVCAGHVRDDGVVLVERYDPSWTRDPASFSGSVGPVEITFEVLAREEDGVTAARLEYRLLDRRWTQEFRFVRATDELVAREAAAQGLVLAGVHGEDRTWLELRPAP